MTNRLMSLKEVRNKLLSLKQGKLPMTDNLTDRETLNKAIVEICEKVTKVEVIDDPVSNAYRHLVCMRVEDVPIPATEARIENCPKCGIRIWVSTNSPTGPDRICYHCFLPIIANEQELTIAISTKAAQKLRA